MTPTEYAINAAREDIIAQAARNPDTHYVWITPIAGDNVPDNIERIDATTLSPSDISSLKPDVLILDHALPAKWQQAMPIIASARDQSNAKIVLIDNPHNAYAAQGFIDMGFIRLDELAPIYGFDLRNYRATPEWLNADNWANPERWDKERW